MYKIPKEHIFADAGNIKIDVTLFSKEMEHLLPQFPISVIEDAAKAVIAWFDSGASGMISVPDPEGMPKDFEKKYSDSIVQSMFVGVGLRGKSFIDPEDPLDNLYIRNGACLSVNEEALDFCLENGIQDKNVALAETTRKSSKEFAKVTDTKQASEDALYKRYSSVSSLLKRIERSDPPDVKSAKKKARERLWKRYFDEKERINIKYTRAWSELYAKRFFDELKINDDAVGWSWKVSKLCENSEPCKRSAGIYKKGEGPHYPQVDTCGCHLDPVYKWTEEAKLLKGDI